MIKTAFASSIGRVRETNQDFVKVFKNQNNIIMGIVCDGMGGHQGGDVASTMAVSHLGHNFEKTDFTDPDLAQKWLTVQLRLENETILNTADRFSDLNGMGTTIVLANGLFPLLFVTILFYIGKQANSNIISTT